MSRTIEVTDPKKLSEDDRRYLAERGRLPKGARPVALNPDFTPLGDLPHTGDANTLAISTEELEAELKRRREAEVKQAKDNLKTDKEELARQKANKRPSSAEARGSVDDDDDDGDDSPREMYKKEDGWTDEKLQAELRIRGLDTEGDRKELRTRLLKNDRSNES